MLRKGLVVFFGESFRLGGQGTRHTGAPESFSGQMDASHSQCKFLDNLRTLKECSIDVHLETYRTQYDNKLKAVYKDYLVRAEFHASAMGLRRLLQTVIKNLPALELYDFVLIMRIDLYLKDPFIALYNPAWNTVRVPSVCFIPHHKTGVHPRINSMMFHFPKKYYPYMEYMIHDHDFWAQLVDTAGLTYADLDTMLDTYHDSDSDKDFNPIYRIVNRGECAHWHSEGHVFDKNTF